MKEIKEKIQEQYQKIINLLDQEENKTKLFRNRHHRLKKQENEELMTGIIVVALIIIIIFSLAYYLLIFAPQQEELNNLKQEKINTVNTLLVDDDGHNKEAIIAEIESKNTIEELNNLDVNLMIHPILKNTLLQQIKEYKDKYDRIEIITDNTTDIMNTENATNYINSQETTTLSTIKIKPVDSVIIPLNINRKQAASGFLSQGDKVDIYKTTKDEEIKEYDENNTENTTINTSTKIVGGSTVVSILRSKDSGNIEQNMELSETPKNRNMSQSSSLDIQQILSSRAAGTYDEKQIKLLLNEYGVRLSNYERTSNIGDLDVEYIIMLEVPRDSVENLIDNMDNIILTIPTYDAPSWVKL
ncbi:MAG: DUF515 domain-containing protein [Methanosphaera sp.]|nr:DUF515 domain-containing protein [Methanosphaera sp.]